MKRLFRGLLFAGRLFAGSLFRGVGPRRPTHPAVPWSEPDQRLAWGVDRPAAEWANPSHPLAWAVQMIALKWSIATRALRWFGRSHARVWQVPTRQLRWALEDEMSATADQPLSITRGEDAAIPFTNAAPPESGIAGWDLLFVIAGRTAPPVISLTTSDGITIDDPTAGTITVTIPRATTLLLSAGVYRWELWRTGTNLPLAGGQLTVQSSIRPDS